MQIGSLVSFKNISKACFLKQGDFILINLCVWKEISGELLGNDPNKILKNKVKRRPIVILEVRDDRAYYIALSTNDKVDRSIELKFDLTKCNLSEKCKDFNFKKEAYIFAKSKKIKRGKKKVVVKVRLNADLNKISKLIDDKDTQKIISKNCEQKIESIYDVFTFCSNCDREYIIYLCEKVKNE